MLLLMSPPGAGLAQALPVRPAAIVRISELDGVVFPPALAADLVRARRLLRERPELAARTDELVGHAVTLTASLDLVNKPVASDTPRRLH